MTSYNQKGRGLRALPRLAWAGTLLALPLAACDTESILEVNDPSFATPETLSNERALPVLVAGALSDFQIAYSGAGDDSFLSVSALISDEYYASDTFLTRQATDQRMQFPAAQGNTSDGAFVRLQQARRSTAEAATRVQTVTGNANDARIAELRSLEGFTYVALGEGFCGNIPFSTSPGGSPGEFGQPLTTQQVFQEGAGRFDQALAATANSQLAAIGKGRALLNNGDFAGAAAAVAGVQTNYVYFIEHSVNTGRQFNPSFSLQDNRRYSVSDREGINGLPFRSARDVRLPNDSIAAGGFDGTSLLFFNRRYPNQGSDVPLATGVEARLIQAEAALRAGNTGAWLATLNALRADAPALLTRMFPGAAARFTSAPAALSDPGTAAGRVDLMFSERAFWLYTTGHRLGDLRRLIRQYNRTEDQVYPTGPYFKGGQYGDDVNFPVPFNETNNTNYDATQCVTTQA